MSKVLMGKTLKNKRILRTSGQGITGRFSIWASCGFFLLFFLPVIWTPDPSFAAIRSYSVQTGSFLGLDRAKVQFDELALGLDKSFLDDLRIQKWEKYYIVRFGAFPVFGQASSALESVKSVAEDAFILNDPPAAEDNILLLYPDISASGESYCLDTGNFDSREKADHRLNFLKTSLGDDLTDSLRIVENEDKTSFRVLCGAYKTLGAARKARNLVRTLVPEAGIINAASIESGDPPDADETAESPDNKPEMEDDGPESMGDEMAKEIVKPIEDIESHMEELLDNQEYGMAVELIKKAIDRWPDNPELYAWYGTTLISMERPDKALEYYQKAADLAPVVPDYQSDVGYSHMQIHMNSTKSAIDAFNRALALDPDNPDALEGLGTVYVSIGERELAEDIENKLKGLDPYAAERLSDLIQHGIDWSN